jgi:hypothetical protein
MTVNVTTKDHRTESFATETAEQAVGYLWKMAFVRESSPDQYMVEVARRVLLYNRHVVRTDNAIDFLTDLAEAGLLSVTFTDNREEPQ